MSYRNISIEEIHTLQGKMESLAVDCPDVKEVLQISEEIDSMLTK